MKKRRGNKHNKYQKKKRPISAKERSKKGTKENGEKSNGNALKKPF